MKPGLESASWRGIVTEAASVRAGMAASAPRRIDDNLDAILGFWDVFSKRFLVPPIRKANGVVGG